MVEAITRFSVQVNARHNVRDVPAAACYESAMTEGWFDRLEEAIRSDGRSLKRLSEDAHFGTNFVQQMLKDKKDPGIRKLEQLFAVMRPGTDIYVFTGAKMTEQDLEFLRAISLLDDDARRDALAVLRRLAGTVSPPTPEAADPAKGFSKAGASQ